MGKVEYGFSNVHYALWDDTASKYSIPVAVAGGVKMSWDPEGSDTKFYADNGLFFTNTTNNGYTGTLEVARADATFLKDVFGMLTDDNGMLLESTSSKQAQFALMFETDSNEGDPIKFVFYNCTAARPSREANTTSDTSDPDTQSFDVTMIQRSFPYDGASKDFTYGMMEKTTANTTKYDAFYTDVVVPTKVAA